MSQVQAAETIGLSSTQFIKLESGDSTLLSAEHLADLVYWEGWKQLDTEPTISELCFLARRRSGMSIKEIADQIGVSTVTFTKIEENGDDRVRDFWIRKGYKFKAPATPIRRPAA
jgi:DNA-binding XRE family transcriptional regulator